MKKPTYKWGDFDENLQNYFLARFSGIVIAVVIGIVCAFLIKRLSIMLFYFAFVLLYGAWLGFIYFQAIYNKIRVYEGECTSKDLKNYSLNTPISKKQFTIYGKSNASMLIRYTNENGEEEDVNVLVPIGYNYDIKEKNILKVYTLSNSVFPKNENTYIITNPLIVKVAKN